MTLSLNSYVQKQAEGDAPKQVVILLHGYGSNGQDLISLAPYWQRALPHALFISPDAPQPCELAPAQGFQWFSLMADSTNEMDIMPVKDPAKYLPGVRAAATPLNQYIDEVLAEYAIEPQNLALMGFSQGCMMSLQVGLRRAPSIAGVLGYSGSLIDDEGLTEAAKIPVCLIHGQADDVVPLESYTHARARLKALGYEVSGHSTPRLGHSIDNDGVEEGARFLQSCFA